MSPDIHDRARRRFLKMAASGIGFGLGAGRVAAEKDAFDDTQLTATSYASRNETIETNHGTRRDPIYPQYQLELGSGVSHVTSYVVNSGYGNEEVVHMLGVAGNLLSTERGEPVKQIPWHGVEARTFDDNVSVDGVDYAVGATDGGNLSSGDLIPASYRLVQLFDTVAGLFDRGTDIIPVVDIASEIAYGLDWVAREVVPGESESHTWGRDTKRAAHQGVFKFRYPTGMSPQIKLSTACTSFLQHDYYLTPTDIPTDATRTASTLTASSLDPHHRRALDLDAGDTIQPVPAAFEIQSETKEQTEVGATFVDP